MEETKAAVKKAAVKRKSLSRTIQLSIADVAKNAFGQLIKLSRWLRFAEQQYLMFSSVSSIGEVLVLKNCAQELRVRCLLLQQCPCAIIQQHAFHQSEALMLSVASVAARVLLYIALCFTP